MEKLRGRCRERERKRVDESMICMIHTLVDKMSIAFVCLVSRLRCVD